MNVETVFKVGSKDDYYTVKGCGQEAASHIRSQFPNKRIVLLGFYIDSKFVQADLLFKN